MIAPTRAALFADARRFRRPERACGAMRIVVAIEAATRATPAPPPRPRRIAGGLSALLCDGRAMADPDAACAAARAFSAGDGFLPGQMVDRTI